MVPAAIACATLECIGEQAAGDEACEGREDRDCVIVHAITRVGRPKFAPPAEGLTARCAPDSRLRC